MSNTKIEYLTKSWNPIQTKTKGESGQGYHCTHVDEGCRNCWAEGMNNRVGNKLPFDTKKFEFMIKRTELDKPFSWKEPHRVGVQFMGDLFHKDIPFEFVDEVFDIMCTDLVKKCKHKDCELSEECFRSVTRHDYFVLTKRPERISEFLMWVEEWGDTDKPFARTISEDKMIPNNIWLGTSISDQQSAVKRVPELLRIKELFPSASIWISAEPLLGEIDLSKCFARGYFRMNNSMSNESVEKLKTIMEKYRPPIVPFESFEAEIAITNPIGWVVCGGESGKGARPTHPDWVRRIRDDCKSASIPFFFKQWGVIVRGDQIPEDVTYNMMDKETERELDLDGFYKVGKKKAGRLLDGVLYDEYPKGVRNNAE